MFNPRVEQIKQAQIGGKPGSGLDDIRVYMRPSRQYNQGVGDFIRNIFRTVRPVIMHVNNTWVKTSAESLKKAASLMTLLSRP